MKRKKQIQEKEREGEINSKAGYGGKGGLYAVVALASNGSVSLPVLYGTTETQLVSNSVVR